MIQAHSLSWTAAQAADRLRTYRRLLALWLVLDVLLGLVALLAPDFLAHLLAQPEAFPRAWLRAWGALLIAVAIFCVPGWRMPLAYRWPNWCGIAMRVAMAIFWLVVDHRIIPLGLYFGVSAVILIISYQRLNMADLLRRP